MHVSNLLNERYVWEIMEFNQEKNIESYKAYEQKEELFNYLNMLNNFGGLLLTNYQNNYHTFLEKIMRQKVELALGIELAINYNMKNIIDDTVFVASALQPNKHFFFKFED